MSNFGDDAKSSQLEYREHQSVLANECLSFLDPTLNNIQKNNQNNIQHNNQDLWMFDLTFGAGGHSLLFLKKFPNLKIFAFDQDEEAIKNGQKLIEKEKLEGRLILNFSNMAEVKSLWEDFQLTQSIKISPQIILADLGVSSHQFDEPTRGFSFRFDGPLDMRMDKQKHLTAEMVINEYSESELAEIFSELGEEKYSKKIAYMIVKKRKEKVFQSTKELEDLCFHSYPPNQRHKGKNPSTLVFQALRLYINKELDVLEAVIPQLWELLAPEGKMGIISFHSLEDRIVKHQFKSFTKVDEYIEGVGRNPHKKNHVGQLLTKKPIIANEEELSFNLRSRSAKLRVIQKISS